MNYYFLNLSYDGRGFSGWQTQPNSKTIQDELSRGLSVLKLNGKFKSSGRTDAGVSARQQTVLLELEEKTDPQKLFGSLNGILPAEISILSLKEIPDFQDPRHKSLGKCYSYKLGLSYKELPLHPCWAVGPNFDIKSACTAAGIFEGTHDFSSFRASDCCADSTVRTLSLSQFTRTDDSYLEYRVHGKGFLKQMVRIMVGTLVEVGKRKISVSDVHRILQACKRDFAGPTAPAEPLTLEWVN